jgi:hypothetical protein
LPDAYPRTRYPGDVEGIVDSALLLIHCLALKNLFPLFVVQSRELREVEEINADPTKWAVNFGFLVGFIPRQKFDF